MFAGAERPLHRGPAGTGDYHIRPLEVRGGTSRGTEGSDMLRAEIRHFQPISCSWDTMTTRSAALASISLTVVLLALVAVAAIFSGEISERNLGIVTTVLASLGTVMTGLLIFLRLETVNSKADEAAANAKAARHETAVMKGTVERVHYDLLNGGLRDNVKRALREGTLEQAMRDEMQRRAEEKPT